MFYNTEKGQFHIRKLGSHYSVIKLPDFTEAHVGTGHILSTFASAEEAQAYCDAWDQEEAFTRDQTAPPLS
ncbi:hypothetical protein [Ferroacidibacillus organovorans]|uniref:Uncharacterized protein n=1 Tax=Ferroacidibacillus organovorans TaxID=1765683 RepID=A0A101XNC3_9BACL|nr:hypothetical protein [Ferroacidibacillus organovorans]KUO94588.1 hypothetical protein ATW55_04130 [Ferroacidibacillus organovorans]